MSCCGSCDQGHACEDTSVAVIQSETGPVSIWGPFSVEMRSDDNRLIRLSAIEKALPQIIEHGRFSVNHDDAYMVGKVEETLTIDPGNVSDERVKRMIQTVTKAHNGLPTGIIEVTPEIAAVFPRLKPVIGERAAFCGGTFLNHNRISKQAQEDALEGRLNSFSLSGVSYDTRDVEHCDALGCAIVKETNDMDLSAITLTSAHGTRSSFGASKARNAGAGFVVVSQAEAREAPVVLTTRPQRVAQAIDARGLQFESFDACVLWAEDQEGITDPAAFCSALERDTRTGGDESVDQDEVAEAVNRQPEVPMTRDDAQGTIMPDDAKQTGTAEKQADGEGGNVQDVLVEQQRRIEELEQRLADLMSYVEAMDEEPEPEPEPEEDEPEEAMEADAEPDDEEEEEEEKMDEATIATAVAQAVSEALKPLNQKLDALSQANAKPKAKAKVKQAVTPKPASIDHGAPAPEVDKLVQAINKGDPAGFMDLTAMIKGGAE